MTKKPSNLRQMLHDLLTFFSKTYVEVFGITDGPPLHDPVALAAILPTDEISWDIETVRVHVSCNDDDQVGRTLKRPRNQEVNEVRGEQLGAPGELVETLVKIPRSCDVTAFWSVILTSVAQADGRYTWE